MFRKILKEGSLPRVQVREYMFEYTDYSDYKGRIFIVLGYADHAPGHVWVMEPKTGHILPKMFHDDDLELIEE